MMNVQWDKWIMEQLPVRLRTARLFALCSALTSPIVKLYHEFTKWQRKMKIKSGGTPQCCILKRVVHDELGVVIEISEGDGKPVDFILRTSFADLDKERQLFALLDRCKLAGKSYAYENAMVAFDGRWTEFVCERQELSWEWGGRVCEVILRQKNVVMCDITNRIITVSPLFPPASDLVIKFRALEWEGSIGKDYIVNVIVPKGCADKVTENWDSDAYRGITVSVNILIDEIYLYTWDWKK